MELTLTRAALLRSFASATLSDDELPVPIHSARMEWWASYVVGIGWMHYGDINLQNTFILLRQETLRCL